MAQAILHDGQNVLVLTYLGEEQRCRAEPGLFETRRIEVEPGERPQHPAAAQRCCARGNPHREQCGSCIICKGRCRRRRLVQTAERQAAARQSRVYRFDAERQDRTLTAAYSAYGAPQAGQCFEGWGGRRHHCCDSYVRYMFR